MADRLTASAEAITLRAITPGDRDFLLALYGSTREAEERLLQWDAAQWASFITQQFAAQGRQYRATYPDGRFQIVEAGGKPVGRLYVARLERHLHIIDIALMPSARNRGIGSGLLRDLLDEADREGVAVTLHVESRNPAGRLYERFGFRRHEAGPVYELMERPAGRTQLKTASY